MILFLRHLVFRDFWLKLFSLALAILIWLVVSFAIQKDVAPSFALNPNIKEHTFSDLPVVLMSSAADVRDFRVTPQTVEVTVRGDAKTLEKLTGKDIRVLVDLTGIEGAHDLRKRIDVSTPVGVTHVRVVPDEVQVSIPTKRSN